MGEGREELGEGEGKGGERGKEGERGSWGIAPWLLIDAPESNNLSDERNVRIAGAGSSR